MSEEIAISEETENLEQTQPQYEIPDKFKNKSVEDVIKSYSELEKQFGKQAQELGDVRKLADQMIQRELSNQYSQKEQPEKEEPFEFDYDNPKESIQKLVNDAIKPLQDNLAKTEGYITIQQLQAKHPDFKDVGSSDEFRQWVNSSPIRQDLYHQADNQGNIDAAMELLDTFKQLNSFNKKGSTNNKSQEVENRVNEMTTETGSTGQSQGKTWSRKDIINLKAYKPQEYKRLQPEIYRAYQEGRVKS